MPEYLPRHIWELTVQKPNGDWHYVRTGKCLFDTAINEAIRYRQQQQPCQLVSIVNVDGVTHRPLATANLAAWKHNEFGFCAALVTTHGDANVGHDPQTVATYLRHQASAAFRDGEYEISARLGAAAMCINEDARNNHEPNWQRAAEVMHVPAHS
jgi:hypothetical protein